MEPPRSFRVVQTQPELEPAEIEASPRGLSFHTAKGTFRFSLDELTRQVGFNDGLILKRTVLPVLDSKRAGLMLAEEDVVPFLAALGPENATRWLVEQRTRYFIPIGLAFLLLSLPLMTERPVDAVGVGLGIGLMTIGLIAKRRPLRDLLMADALWFVAFSADIAADVMAKVDHPGWLAVAALGVLAVASALKMHKRLAQAAVLAGSAET